MKSTKPQISVLIPVYNSAKYLPECLKSLEEQTFQDFEIICINDGSKDNSLSVLEDFQKRDGRIKIINQNNQGIAITRNRLLKEGSGKYIAFIDSDDWVKPDYFKMLFNAAESANADIIKCRFVEFDDNNKTYHKANCTKTFYKEPADNPASKFKSGLYDSLVWGKLWRRDFIIRNKITFPLGCVAEDFPFVAVAFMLSAKTVYLKDVLYIYRKNNYSITSNAKNMIISVLKNTLSLGRELSERNLCDSKVCDVLVKEIVWRLCALRKLPVFERQKNKILIDTAQCEAKNYLKKATLPAVIRFNLMFLLIKICRDKSLYFWAKVFR